MISSIQLREEVKLRLARHKERESESFEEVIVRIINEVEKQKREKKELLIEQCKEMYNDNLKITKKWESTDDSLEWEW